MTILEEFRRLAKILIGFLGKPVLQVRFGYDGSIHVGVVSTKPTDIDDRIARLDQARDNLASAIVAIDELKASAERNKVELSNALQRIEAAREAKAAAEKELGDVRRIAESDIGVFRRLAGIPNRAEIALDRILAFIVGVGSSLLAAMLWRWIVK